MKNYHLAEVSWKRNRTNSVQLYMHYQLCSCWFSRLADLTIHFSFLTWLLLLQMYASQYFTQITELLRRLPRVILLMLKTNDCLRAVSNSLVWKLWLFNTWISKCSTSSWKLLHWSSISYMLLLVCVSIPVFSTVIYVFLHKFYLNCHGNLEPHMLLSCFPLLFQLLYILLSSPAFWWGPDNHVLVGRKFVY